jgi:hypothetical protein
MPRTLVATINKTISIFCIAESFSFDIYARELLAFRSGRTLRIVARFLPSPIT